MTNYNIPPLIRERQERSQQAMDELNKKVGYSVFRTLRK